MNHKQVLELINPIASGLIEEADLPLPGQGRPSPMLRAAVIAACLCLALVGTGFAAGQFYRLMVRMETADPESPGYSVQGNVDKFPLDQFSGALLSASEARFGPGAVVQLEFDTFKEVQEFLGRDIPALWPNGGEGWTGRYCVYLFHTEIDKLWMVEVWSFSEDAQATITLTLYTEHWRGGLDTNIAGLHATSDDAIERLEPYPMPNGAEAEIILCKSIDPKYTGCNCLGHFIRGGILYTVEVTGGQEEAPSRLKAVLDCFS